MKNWFVNIVSAVLLCASLTAQAQSSAVDRKIEVFQRALAHWDLPAAEAAEREISAAIPDSELTAYLRGTIAFYRGNYAKADEQFKRIKNIGQYEPKTEGFNAITQAILKEKIQFTVETLPTMEIHFAPGPDAVMLPLLAENGDRLFQAVNKALDFKEEHPVLIEIYPSSDAFVAASPLTRVDIETSGTIALCKYGRILLTTPRSLLRGYPWLDTMSHEYVHYVLTRKWGSNIPVWLHEGLAKYLEGQWRADEGDASYLSPSFESALAGAIRKDQFVTFAQMHPSFAKLPSAEIAQQAYAQVASFIDFLVVDQGGFAKIYRVLDHLRDGLEYPQAFQKAYGISLDKQMALWKIWLKKRNLHEIDGIDPRSLQFVDARSINTAQKVEEVFDRKEIEQVKSTTVQEHLRLGDLLRYRGRTTAAIVEYDRAQKGLKGVSPIISNKLAKAYLEHRQYDKAAKLMHETLAIYPDEELSLRLLGDIHMLQGELDLAAKNYERSLHINPFNPLVYQRLATIYAKKGPEEKKKRSEEALRLLQGKD